MKAFPCEWLEWQEGKCFDLATGIEFDGKPVRKSSTGMDLRDYFAAKAMQAGYEFLFREMPCEVDEALEDIVSGAYKIADLMMKEREK